MGNCFRGSPTDDFTRLRTDDPDTETTPARNGNRSANRPPAAQQQQRRVRKILVWLMFIVQF